MFQPVKLFTRGGGLVVEGRIPAFNIPPEVITWGLRTFIHDDSFNLTDDATGYVEGIVWPLEASNVGQES